MKKNALVTGGTRGIGEAISMALKQAGYQVIANYGTNRAAAQVFSEKTGIPAVPFDVSSFERTSETIGLIEEEWGPIDILVNNAGITRDFMAHHESWNEVLQANLTSCFNTCRAILPGMRERSFGRVINISSLHGQTGQCGQTNYAAAKAGMLGFTKALAMEVASKGITVNAVAPGMIDTDMVKIMPSTAFETMLARIPMGRMGQASEIGQVVAFLAGEGAGFITGTTISANGGQCMV